MIGDYGMDNANQLAVANLVKTNFQPEFIVTVGDNNYLGADQIDRAIGKYYSDFIGNYNGAYGTGASSNRFFPALGNHDWYSGSGYAAHTNYFTLPGNERYYDFVRGPVHFFILNSDPNEPDGTSATSVQALWFSNRITASTSPWRVVVSQDPPYSSTEGHSYMRWPFEAWGADMVVSGDSHHYERIMRNGFPYIVNGAGGAALAGFGAPVTGSEVRYNAAHGAVQVSASSSEMLVEFWSVASGGILIDRFSLKAAPTLSALHTNHSVLLRWPTSGATGFILQSTVSFDTWSAVTNNVSSTGDHHEVVITPGGSNRFFRLFKP